MRTLPGMVELGLTHCPGASSPLLVSTSVFRRKVALLRTQLAYTSVSWWREFIGPSISFLVEEWGKTPVHSLLCFRAGLNLWIREVFRFIYLLGFGEEKGNPLKGDLASFEGFCFIVLSIHATLGKCFCVLGQVMIADHCLGLNIAAFPGCLLGSGMSLWHIPILKFHLPLPGWCILLFCVHASKI